MCVTVQQPRLFTLCEKCDVEAILCQDEHCVSNSGQAIAQNECASLHRAQSFQNQQKHWCIRQQDFGNSRELRAHWNLYFSHAKISRYKVSELGGIGQYLGTDWVLQQVVHSPLDQEVQHF